MDRPKPQPLGNRAPVPVSAPQGKPPVRLPIPTQIPGRWGPPGLGPSPLGDAQSQAAQAAARYQALHAEMYEEILGQQTFSYVRAGAVCARLAQEPKGELASEVRAMILGTIALRIFHDRSEESYKILGKRHLMDRLIELLRSDSIGIIRIKMARTTTRNAWLLPATNFAKELAGLMTDPDRIPEVCAQVRAILPELSNEPIVRDFFKDAGRLAVNMARGPLAGRPELIQELVALFA